MKNKIEDLRNHLFAVIEGLSDPDNPMEIDRAIAIANVAQVLINSAKVEVEFMRVTDSVRGSGFIPSDAAVVTARTAIERNQLSQAMTVSTVHQPANDHRK